MFFRRGQQGKGADAASIELAADLVAAVAPVPLAAGDVRRSIDAGTLGFASTAELPLADGLIGQERALRALQFGADMAAPDFNLFVLGPPATGKQTAVRAHLAQKFAAAPPPDDWVYVNDFEIPGRARAIRLPAGRARGLARGMLSAIDELRVVLPAVFDSDDYQARRRAVNEGFRAGQEGALDLLARKAETQGIALVRTPTGIAMGPMLDGKIVKPEVFAEMPEKMRREVERKIVDLQKELEALMARTPRLDKDRRAELAKLNDGYAHGAVRAALDDVAAAHVDVPGAIEHLEAAGRDLIRHVALFLPEREAEGAEDQIVEPVETARDPRFRRYLINVLAGGSGEAHGAPVIEEPNPTLANLVGRVEHVAQMGTLVTDFLLIKPGALHRANGGCLLLDARRLLQAPFAWDALKRALAAREIRIESPLDQGPMSVPSLDMTPIPLAVKVVLFGDRELFARLADADPDFGGLFKVQVDFDDAIALTPENTRDFTRLLASVVARHKLNPLDAGGAARVIEQAIRMADDRDKLSIAVGRLSDLMREANYLAVAAGATTTTRAHVAAAVAAATQRADRLRDRAFETIERRIIMVDTAGAKIGQVNGLAVLQTGDFAFGRPSRITVRVRMGSGRVTDIEREAKLAGPLHTKGMLILWGVLAGRYAQDVPLSLAASIVFEQSYGGVDGDSASSTELYALLSALAEVPIRQALAVTGSVNQWGEVQAIGGVNEKIEGFFDICKASGLGKDGNAGGHGVVIPAANTQHLMLREDVAAAVAAGTFAIYPVASIDAGIEILTGVAAGERDGNGRFPPGTINARVEAKLQAYAEQRHGFGRNRPRNGDGASV